VPADCHCCPPLSGAYLRSAMMTVRAPGTHRPGSAVSALIAGYRKRATIV
jgi:hypothetical protein